LTSSLECLLIGSRVRLFCGPYVACSYPWVWWWSRTFLLDCTGCTVGESLQEGAGVDPCAPLCIHMACHMRGVGSMWLVVQYIWIILVVQYIWIILASFTTLEVHIWVVAGLIMMLALQYYAAMWHGIMPCCDTPCLLLLCWSRVVRPQALGTTVWYYSVAG
jgi:hypothetical protein